MASQPRSTVATCSWPNESQPSTRSGVSAKTRHGRRPPLPGSQSERCLSWRRRTHPAATERMPTRQLPRSAGRAGWLAPKRSRPAARQSRATGREPSPRLLLGSDVPILHPGTRPRQLERSSAVLALPIPAIAGDYPFRFSRPPVARAGGHAGRDPRCAAAHGPIRATARWRRCPLQCLAATRRGCRKNHSTNRCVNRSWDNSRWRRGIGSFGGKTPRNEPESRDLVPLLRAQHLRRGLRDSLRQMQ